jgi:hypothetical protein
MAQSDDLDPSLQLDILVVCPHILPGHTAIRHWSISTNNDDATRVLLGLAFRPSISFFGCWPRGQCDTPFHLFTPIIIFFPPTSNPYNSNSKFYLSH